MILNFAVICVEQNINKTYDILLLLLLQSMYFVNRGNNFNIQKSEILKFNLKFMYGYNTEENVATSFIFYKVTRNLIVGIFIFVSKKYFFLQTKPTYMYLKTTCF